MRIFRLCVRFFLLLQCGGSRFLFSDLLFTTREPNTPQQAKRKSWCELNLLEARWEVPLEYKLIVASCLIQIHCDPVGLILVESR